MRLLKKIGRKERELDLLRERLRMVCPHREIEQSDFPEDNGAQDRTQMLVFRCATCGRFARMTKEEFDALGGSPFKTPG